MSFSIGIYDLFAYTIPGFFYIYVIYVILQRLGLSTPAHSGFPAFPDGYGLLIFVVLLISAHLLGHLLDIFAHWFVFRIFRPYKFSERMLERTKKIHADIEIQFLPKDWGLLFSMLRQRNLEHSRTIDSFEANSIMLRNISFGLFLLGAIQLYEIFLKFNVLGLVEALVLFLFSLIARRRSHMFHAWFLTDIFETSLRFGNSLQEVIRYDQKGRGVAPSTEDKKPTRKRQSQRG
jgi:hypothetical protein